MAGFAWVTLATNDSYSLGALVLAHSLRRVGTQHELAVLITPGVTEPMREKLASVFNLVREVNVLDSKDEANLAVLQRPELGITFTKLHCWRLTQYEKCVFIDADALVVRNCDELFEREELSAAPDVGWPDCFNSGVFVFRPSQQTFASITTFAASQGSFDGADQGLLNMYFSDWAHKDISKHLPFIYNMCSTATYSYAPAFKQYGENVRIIHFIGVTKPWLQYFDTLTGIVQPPPGCNHLQPLLQVWWNIFCDNVHPQLTDVMGGLAGALSKLTLGESRSDEQKAIEDHMRKQNWEQGHIDFMGRDSFDNILKKINETLSSAPARLPSPVKETRQPEKASSKSSEVEAAVEESEVALPVLATDHQAEGSSKIANQRISSSEVTLPSLDEQPQVEASSVRIDSKVDSTICDQGSTLTQGSVEPTENLVPMTQLTEAKIEIAEAVVEPREVTDRTASESSDTALATPLPIVPADKPVEESTIAQTPVQVVSEATTECPVPIQVAESVLQTEPKESVSEDPRLIVEAVVSSIIPPIQESVAAVSETLVEARSVTVPDAISQPQQLNGHDPSLKLEDEIVLPSTVTHVATASVSPDVVSSVDDVVPNVSLETDQVVQAAQGSQPTQPHAEPEDASSLTEVQPEQMSKDLCQRSKLTVKLSSSEDPEEAVTEKEDLNTSPSITVDESAEGPVRPIRSKDLKIPGTPVVIGPTPPTSPPLDTDVAQSTEAEVQAVTKTETEVEKQVESQQTEEKPKKKITKKSSSESDPPSSPETEGSGKKIVKKVKKVKEGEEGASGSDKPKKKIVKKVAKTSSSTSLEADKSVPETPPPGEKSGAPVPPKRKSKSYGDEKALDKKTD